MTPESSPIAVLESLLLPRFTDLLYLLSEVDEIELPERSSDNLRHNDVELPPPERYIEWAKSLHDANEDLALFRFKNVPQRVPENVFWRRVIKAILKRYEQNRSDVSDQPPEGW